MILSSSFSKPPIWAVIFLSYTSFCLSFFETGEKFDVSVAAFYRRPHNSDKFKSCRVCCGRCITVVPQTVDLKVRVRLPPVTPYCRRLTDKPPHYGCGTGGSSPLGSAICIAQRMRALPSEGRSRGFKSHYRYLSVSPNWTRHGSSKPAR